MSQKLYKVEDIQLLFKELKVEIKKLKCFIEDCCAKIPINVGSGATLFKRLYRNNWEFKSILPGSNITITEQDDTITINSIGGDTSNKWDLDGNAISNTDFLGSTNDQDLVFKRNNQEIGRLNNEYISIGLNSSPDVGSVAIGTNSSTEGLAIAIGEDAVSAAQGVAVGYNAIAHNSSVALGKDAIAAISEFALPDTLLYAKWRGIPYEFPSLQGAASTVLTNNGAGVLSWQTTTPSPITTVSDTNTVDLTITATDLTADINYQNTSTINLSEDINGLKADLATGAAIANLGFTPENVANKQTDLTPSATNYPTVDAVNAGLTAIGARILVADYTDVAFTASVAAERIIRTLFVPKGTVPINRMLKLNALVTKVGIGSTTALRIRVATSATPSPISGAGLLANASGILAKETFLPLSRNNIHTQSATSTISSGVNSLHDLIQSTIIGITADWDNVDYWLILTCEHNTTSADAYTSHELILSL